MILFRCWYCNKFHSAPERRVGERITCTCRYPLRIPRRSGGNCKVLSITDWLVQTVVYAGGGGLLGLGLALLIVTQFRWVVGRRDALALAGGLGLFGFLVGLFGGERGVNWIGRMIRYWEER